MLIHAAENETEKLIRLFDRSPEFSVRMSALLKAYGTGWRFFALWVQNESGAVISRLEDTFSVLDCDGADPAELSFFLEFNPYFKRLSGSMSIVEKLFPLFGSKVKLERVNLMSFYCNNIPAKQFPDLSRQPNLKIVYDIINSALPQKSGFMPWYSDLSHRIRHGCARAYLLYDGANPLLHV